MNPQRALKSAYESRSGALPQALGMESSLKDQVISEYGYKIVSGGLQPGEILQLEYLAKERSVSLTVIREAVSVLGSLGLVESRKRLGTVVQPAENWNHTSPLIIAWKLLDPTQRKQQFRWLIEMRSALEPMAAELAAEHRDPQRAAELLELTAQLEKWAEAENLNKFLEVDIAFHELIFAECGNPLVAEISRQMDVVLTARHHFDLMPQRPDSNALNYHRDLAEAIFAGQPHSARKASEHIVIQAAEEFLNSINARPSESGGRA